MELALVWRVCLAFIALSMLVDAVDTSSSKKKRKKKKKGKGDEQTSSVSRTHGLIDDMLNGYDKQNSPHGDNATIVKLGIYINSFYSISEQTMDYSVSIYLRQSWYEPRLAFTPQNNATEQMIKLEDGRWEQIWVPDVYFRNEKKASFHSVTIPNRLMRLYNDGKIWYAMRVSATLACSMLLHKYPLDTQKCPMMLESFGHTERTVIFKFLEPLVDGVAPVGKENTIDLPQFTWADNELESCSVNYSTVGHTMDTVIFRFLDDRPPVAFDEMAEELPQFTRTGYEKVDCSMNYTTGAYPCLMIRFILKRDIGYYLIQVYVPSILIVILSWVAFWINIEAIPARVSLGLLTVLTMTTQSTGARSTLPRVSYIKAIDVWMSMCLIFVFSSLLEFAVVNVFSRKEIKVKTIVDAETLPVGDDTDENEETDDEAQAFMTGIELAGNRSDEINIIVENGKEPRTTKTMIPDPDGKTKARRIDKLARRLFPMAFLIFNVVYWVMYLVF